MICKWSIFPMRFTELTSMQVMVLGVAAQLQTACGLGMYIHDIVINHHITNSSPFLRSLMSLLSYQGALGNRGRIGLSRHKSLAKTLRIASTQGSVAS